MRIINHCWPAAMLVAWILTSTCQAIAQQYVIKEGDKLSITFWQAEDLNTQVTVSHDSTIILPIVGQIKAAGLTPAELGDRIIQQISRFRINITQASVVVTEYQGNKVYITGYVGAPGAYTFEVIPGLWKLIQEAGGLSEGADLQHIKIIRSDAEDGTIVPLDLTHYLERGDLSDLPEIRAGDTIHIPPKVEGKPLSSLYAGIDGMISVLGEVASTGRYNLEKGSNLLDVLILAGGLTASAKLKDVKVIRRSNPVQVVKVNLEKYLEGKQQELPALDPGDTVYVPRIKEGGLGKFVLRMVTTITTSVAVYLALSSVR